MTTLRLRSPMADPPPRFHPPNVYMQLCQKLRSALPVGSPPSPSPSLAGSPNPPIRTHSGNGRESTPAWLTVRRVWPLRRDRNSTQIGTWTTSRKKEGSPRRRYHLGSTPKENPWCRLLWDLDRGCLLGRSFLGVFRFAVGVVCTFADSRKVVIIGYLSIFSQCHQLPPSWE